MRKPTGTLVFIEHGSSRLRHDGELAIVVDPGTGLVSLLQPSYFIRGISIGPPVTHLSGLRCPKVHTPRHGHHRIGVAG